MEGGRRQQTVRHKGLEREIMADMESLRWAGMKEGLPTSEIEKIVSSVKTWNPSTSNQAEAFLYIDLSSVDQKEKRIVTTSNISAKEAPSRARQLVHEGDVLVSTVRPNLNGVAYVPRELDGATASTGFCVLRPKQDKLEGRYLYHWVQSPQFVDEMVKFATGASYPAISDRIVKNSQIPLPPLVEQKRIAAILDKADAIRRKRQQAIKLTDDFLRATFLDMFGDPVTNAKGWEEVCLGNVTEDWRGGAPLEPSDFTEKGFAILHKGAIHPNGVIKIDSGKKTYTTHEYAGSHRNSVINNQYLAVTLRDLVPSGPSIGLIADLAQNPMSEYLLAQGAYGFKVVPFKIKPAYLVALSNNRGFRGQLKRYWVGSTQIHIRTPIFKEIPIPLPKFDQQEKYEAIAQKITKKICAQRVVANLTDSLFSSLTQRAFRGEL